MNHPLHKTIGKLIKENFLPEEFEVLLDQSCGGKQSIPLFSTKKKSLATKICDVDILIIKNGKVKALFEIEESNVKPTQICGKFLASALASYYIYHDNTSYDMDKAVLFIQILDTSKLEIEKTSKIKQWDNIEKAIKDILPIKDRHLDCYKIFFGNVQEFGINGERRNELISYLKNYLNNSRHK